MTVSLPARHALQRALRACINDVCFRLRGADVEGFEIVVGDALSGVDRHAVTAENRASIWALRPYARSPARRVSAEAVRASSSHQEASSDGRKAGAVASPPVKIDQWTVTAAHSEHASGP
ncbi:hypothetical protein [Glycomyces sp. YM15]|uniref:hypothetical protein n=1 Tax=Glycomyces sp. YM15 TaxID=2800446 RepID=UPI001962A306|nr:hypothetical protein [Glycomyces sp. YM15]